MPLSLKVYRSDPFHGLSLDSQYAVTVMALPVPEEWEKFYKNKIFSTRCKNTQINKQKKKKKVSNGHKCD